MAHADVTLMTNMSKYQLASKKGHRASEHLYTIMSIISYLEDKKEAVIVSMFDIKKYFDSESLVDAMGELYKCQIKGKLYRLLYKLNENIRVTVKTPVGETESADTGSGVGQGTVDGGIISSASLDGGVTEEFTDVTLVPSETKLLKTSDIPFQDIFHPMMYQDDVFKISADIETAQTANEKMERVIESKLLTLNSDKSAFIVIGERRARKRILGRLEKNPLTLCGMRMKNSNAEKYLGSILSTNMSSSVLETIKKRIPLANKAIYEIRYVLDDKRVNTIGGMTLGFDIFETCIIPFLLHNAETFVGISSKALKLLDKVSLRYLRLVLSVGTGCPIPILFTETNTLLMSNRIWLSKLRFIRHVLTLPVGSLARDIAEKQIVHRIGLIQEVEPLLIEMGISEINSIQHYSKYQWRNMTRKFIFNKNHSDLVSMCEKKNYSKINTEAIRNKPIKVSEYFRDLSVDDSRLKFKLLSRMTPSVASNWSSSKKFRERGLLCVGCSPPSSVTAVTGSETQAQPPTTGTGSRDSESHIEICDAYSDLRNFKSLQGAGDKVILDFFRKVIERRAQQENI